MYNLLGPTAVDDGKTETGRLLDVIGYVIDLNTQRVLKIIWTHYTASQASMSTEP